MLPQIEHFEVLEKEVLARVDAMVDKRVSAVQKQFDQKMKEIEAKNNAMLRM
jgi:vancomycin permeability regulator SanA